jgi:hypothetical protein
MRRGLTTLGVAVALGVGVTAAVALGAGGSSKTSSTSTTTTTATAPEKVWVCHHTGSWTKPYHLIHVSVHALPAHLRHGDVTPGANGSCPASRPAGAKAHGHGGADDDGAEDGAEHDDND